MNYEKLASGLLTPEKKIVLGRFRAEILRGLKSPFADKGDHIFEFDNICVNEGLIYLLNSGFGLTSQITSWYMAVYQNNYTPVSTDTAASIVGNAGEFTGYSGGARPNFTPATAVQPTPQLTNSANRASFTFTGTATLIGAFLISSAGIGSATGSLFSAAQFPSSKSVGNTDQLLLTYTLTASSS